MSDFTHDQVTELYGQHTSDTGQEFTPEALARAFEYSQGQPWLVNAIAYEITGEMGVRPPTRVTAAHVGQAKERLILARATHLDYLAARLAEPRVKKVIEPLLAGDFVTNDPAYNDDVSYVRDLGLIRQSPPIAVANPIYREAIARVPTERAADAIAIAPAGFLLPDGRLDFGKLLEQFAAFWRANGRSRSRARPTMRPLIIFDRRPTALRKHPNPQFTTHTTRGGRQVTVLSA